MAAKYMLSKAKESLIGPETNPMVMENVRLCITTTEKLEGLTTYLALLKGKDTFARVLLTGVTRRVCYTSYSFPFDLLGNLVFSFLSVSSLSSPTLSLPLPLPLSLSLF